MKLRVVLPGPCPYSCVYCYKEGIFTDRERQLDTSDFIFLTKKAGELGFNQFKATGGEPTNYGGLVKIIEAARESDYADIRMTTIGLKLANMDFCRDLKETGLDGVTISVNSFNLETYNKMTGAKEGDFERMKRGLENAIQVFGHSVTLNTVLTRWNANEVGELIEYASQNGLGVKILEMLDEEGIAPLGTYISFGEFKKKSGIRNGKLINPTRELVRIGGARVYFVNSCCARQECKICRKGYHVVRVTPDGKLKTCISNEIDELEAVDTIKRRDEDGLEELLSKAINKFRD